MIILVRDPPSSPLLRRTAPHHYQSSPHGSCAARVPAEAEGGAEAESDLHATSHLCAGIHRRHFIPWHPNWVFPVHNTRNSDVASKGRSRPRVRDCRSARRVAEGGSSSSPCQRAPPNSCPARPHKTHQLRVLRNTSETPRMPHKFPRVLVYLHLADRPCDGTRPVCE